MTHEVFQMSHIRTHFAQRALPVDPVAGVVAAHGGLAHFLYRDPSSPRDNIATLRRHFGGTAVQY